MASITARDEMPRPTIQLTKSRGLSISFFLTWPSYSHVMVCHSDWKHSCTCFRSCVYSRIFVILQHLQQQSQEQSSTPKFREGISWADAVILRDAAFMTLSARVVTTGGLIYDRCKKIVMMSRNTYMLNTFTKNAPSNTCRHHNVLTVVPRSSKPTRRFIWEQCAKFNPAKNMINDASGFPPLKKEASKALDRLDYNFSLSQKDVILIQS